MSPCVGEVRKVKSGVWFWLSCGKRMEATPLPMDQDEAGHRILRPAWELRVQLLFLWPQTQVFSDIGWAADDRIWLVIAFCFPETLTSSLLKNLWGHRYLSLRRYPNFTYKFLERYDRLPSLECKIRSHSSSYPNHIDSPSLFYWSSVSPEIPNQYFLTRGGQQQWKIHTEMEKGKFGHFPRGRPFL